MSARVIALAGVLAVVLGAAALWWWLVRCERDCAAVDRDAQDLFQHGEFLSVLALIDAVDARCRCSRFTSGDSPPQYALAQACLRQLLSEGRNAEVDRILLRARGRILMELTKQLVNAEQEGGVGRSGINDR